MGSKKSPAPVAPQPTFTQVAEKPREPIERTASSAVARDRAEGNTSAELLAGAPSEDDPAKKTQASLMG
jgi:hypothetical protein